MSVTRLMNEVDVELMYHFGLVIQSLLQKRKRDAGLDVQILRPIIVSIRKDEIYWADIQSPTRKYMGAKRKTRASDIVKER